VLNWLITSCACAFCAAGNLLSGAGEAIGNAASTAGDYISSGIDAISDFFSDETLKTDKKEMSDKDIDNMMAQMTAYKYRYKGDKSNPQQMGVMGQDMPKESVIDTIHTNKNLIVILPPFGYFILILCS